MPEKRQKSHPARIVANIIDDDESQEGRRRLSLLAQSNTMGGEAECGNSEAVRDAKVTYT
jgi:hypothetical protein